MPVWDGTISITSENPYILHGRVFYYRKQIFHEDDAIIVNVIEIFIFILSKQFIFVVFILLKNNKSTKLL
jgi:hypothetical protein